MGHIHRYPWDGFEELLRHPEKGSVSTKKQNEKLSSHHNLSTVLNQPSEVINTNREMSALLPFPYASKHRKSCFLSVSIVSFCFGKA